jgi:hypothetical protein
MPGSFPVGFQEPYEEATTREAATRDAEDDESRVKRELQAWVWERELAKQATAVQRPSIPYARPHAASPLDFDHNEAIYGVPELEELEMPWMHVTVPLSMTSLPRCDPHPAALQPQPPALLLAPAHVEAAAPPPQFPQLLL